MIHVLILTPDAHVYRPMVEAAVLPGVTIHACRGVAEAREVVAGCQVILGQPDLVVSVLSEAANLVWVQSTFAGVDALCRPGLRRDYCLTGVKGVFGPLMSEYIFCAILARERQLFSMRRNQEERQWEPMAYRSLRGLTLGVCGLGSIGEHVARTGKHFGMRVVGYRRSGEPCDAVDCLFSQGNFHPFLSGCDYVVALLPATAATLHLFDGAAFDVMKHSAVFMNAGRGSTVQEEALVAALTHGRIAGAVLDVFEGEPLDGKSPLWAMENVLVTPHCSATSFPEEIAHIFCHNFEAYRAGRALNHRVDFQLGY